MVQEALLSTAWRPGSKASSLIPRAMVASAGSWGSALAEITTRRTVPRRWAAASLRRMKRPVASTTTETPAAVQSTWVGSPCWETGTKRPSISSPPWRARTSPG